ncbi:unnamed protein product [Lathyrus sativus]|nr:unnamed protein product [Lathyrus sativus]
MMSASTSTSHNTNPLNTEPRKRLIVKLSYPPGSRKRDSDSCGTNENKRRKIQDSVKPNVTCYWVDSDYRTKTTSLSETKHNNVVEDKKMIENQVSKTTPLSQPKDNNVVENKKMIKNPTQPKDNNVVENKKMIKNRTPLSQPKDNKMIKNRTPLSQPKDNNLVENKKMIKNPTQPKDNNVVENKKMIKNPTPSSQPKDNKMIKNRTPLSQPKNNTKDSSKTAFVTRVEECGLKQPMECVRRRQCWLILKRMLVDRDGWDLKDPPKIAMVDKCKIKTIGLKEIERKLRLYATPDEFASDIRLVFSNAMLMYPPRNHIYQIAKKFSQNFEHKWKSLKDMWDLEDTKRSKTHKSTRY